MSRIDELRKLRGSILPDSRGFTAAEYDLLYDSLPALLDVVERAAYAELQWQRHNNETDDFIIGAMQELRAALSTLQSRANED
jgi:hypothetical protein